jgi:hypothetical protein
MLQYIRFWYDTICDEIADEKFASPPKLSFSTTLISTYEATWCHNPEEHVLFILHFVGIFYLHVERIIGWFIEISVSILTSTMQIAISELYFL